MLQVKSRRQEFAYLKVEIKVASLLAMLKDPLECKISSCSGKLNAKPRKSTDDRDRLCRKTGNVHFAVLNFLRALG